MHTTEAANTDGLVEQSGRAVRRAGTRDPELGVANAEPATPVALVRLVGAAESSLNLPDDQAPDDHRGARRRGPRWPARRR